MSADHGGGPMQLAREGVVQNLVNERAFAGAADAGEHNELIAGQIQVDISQIVFASPANRDSMVVHFFGNRISGVVNRRTVSIQMLQTARNGEKCLSSIERDGR
jgi:hypothetical protein